MVVDPACKRRKPRAQRHQATPAQHASRLTRIGKPFGMIPGAIGHRAPSGLGANLEQLTHDSHQFSERGANTAANVEYLAWLELCGLREHSLESPHDVGHVDEVARGVGANQRWEAS